MVKDSIEERVENSGVRLNDPTVPRLSRYGFYLHLASIPLILTGLAEQNLIPTHSSFFENISYMSLFASNTLTLGMTGASCLYELYRNKKTD